MTRRRKTIAHIAFYLLVAVLFLMGTTLGERAVTVFSEEEPFPRKNRIVIDAGHGGEDGGATGCSGGTESTLNLEIALRLNDLFHLLGYKTVMIRTSDTAVYTTGSTIAQKKVSDLKERVRIVNETENAVLLSIHQNYFADARYSGAQVFYAQNEGSEELAKVLQQSFVDTINLGSNRKCKRASGIYLMEHITCPGVLVECGFLSNAEEENRLKTENYQKKIVCIIASSVSNFLS